MDRNISPVTTTKSAWTGRHRRAAATDLFLRATLLLQGGADQVYAELVALIAIDVMKNEDPEAEYRDGLGECDVAPSAIDAAVGKVLDAEYPTDSVLGRVDACRTEAESEGEKLPSTHRVQVARLGGRSDAFAHVLQMFGPAGEKAKL
jgi:hypothetical protein